jgi:hypothetical protein
VVAAVGHGLHQPEADHRHAHRGDEGRAGLAAGIRGRVPAASPPGDDLEDDPPHEHREYRERGHARQEADERPEDDAQDHE